MSIKAAINCFLVLPLFINATNNYKIVKINQPKNFFHNNFVFLGIPSVPDTLLDQLIFIFLITQNTKSRILLII